MAVERLKCDFETCRLYYNGKCNKFDNRDCKYVIAKDVLNSLISMNKLCGICSKPGNCSVCMPEWNISRYITG